MRPLQILSDERHHGLLDLHVFLLFHHKLLVSLLRAVKDWPELRLAPRFGRLLSEKGGLRHWKRKVGSKSVPGSLPGFLLFWRALVLKALVPFPPPGNQFIISFIVQGLGWPFGRHCFDLVGGSWGPHGGPLGGLLRPLSSPRLRSPRNIGPAASIHGDEGPPRRPTPSVSNGPPLILLVRRGHVHPLLLLPVRVVLHEYVLHRGESSCYSGGRPFSLFGLCTARHP